MNTAVQMHLNSALSTMPQSLPQLLYGSVYTDEAQFSNAQINKPDSKLLCRKMMHQFCLRPRLLQTNLIRMAPSIITETTVALGLRSNSFSKGL